MLVYRSPWSKLVVRRWCWSWSKLNASTTSVKATEATYGLQQVSMLWAVAIHFWLPVRKTQQCCYSDFTAHKLSLMVDQVSSLRSRPVCAAIISSGRKVGKELLAMIDTCGTPQHLSCHTRAIITSHNSSPIFKRHHMFKTYTCANRELCACTCSLYQALLFYEPPMQRAWGRGYNWTRSRAHTV